MDIRQFITGAGMQIFVTSEKALLSFEDEERSPRTQEYLRMRGKYIPPQDRDISDASKEYSHPKNLFIMDWCDTERETNPENPPIRFEKVPFTEDELIRTISSTSLIGRIDFIGGSTNLVSRIIKAMYTNVSMNHLSITVFNDNQALELFAFLKSPHNHLSFVVIQFYTEKHATSPEVSECPCIVDQTYFDERSSSEDEEDYQSRVREAYSYERRCEKIPCTHQNSVRENVFVSESTVRAMIDWCENGVLDVSPGGLMIPHRMAFGVNIWTDLDVYKCDYGGGHNPHRVENSQEENMEWRMTHENVRLNNRKILSTLLHASVTPFKDSVRHIERFENLKSQNLLTPLEKFFDHDVCDFWSISKILARLLEKDPPSL